jgi:hypothetical protein
MSTPDLSARLDSMFKTGLAMIDAEHAFARARRSARLRRTRGDLPVYRRPMAGSRRGGVREIPVDAITGTLEPSRARQFDAEFRPRRKTIRQRWERIWIAEEQGVALPPISVVPIGEVYAVRDGHHRVSVARARGAFAIDAVIA